MSGDRMRVGMRLIVPILVLTGFATAADALFARDKPPAAPPARTSQAPPFDAGLYRDIKREWQKAERDRASGPRRQQRRDSRSAYRGLTRSGAKAVERQRFRETFEAPLGLDLRAAAGGKPEFINDHVAKLEHDGRTALVEGTLPLRDDDRVGKPAPVDLRLQERATTYASANPLVEVNFPKDAGRGISLPAVGVTVTPLPVSAAAPERVGDRLFWANVAPDTDLAAMPVATGFETVHFLRSPASPEELRLRVGMPAGSSLRLAGNDPSARGAEVMRDGHVLAAITAPAAVDADGTAVPVVLAVEDSDLLLRVAHRDGDYRYPIAVDPTVRDDYPWYPDNPNVTALGWHYDSPSSIYGTFRTKGSALEGPWGYGLYIHKDQWTPAGSFGNWFFPAYGDATIYRVDTNHVYHSRPNTGVATDSSAIALGIWSPGRQLFESLFMSGATIANGNDRRCARASCSEADGGDSGNAFVFRVHKDYGGSTMADVGIAYIYQADKVKPHYYGAGVKYQKRTGSGAWQDFTLGSAAAPTGWQKDGLTIAAEPFGEDNGFGVERLHVIRNDTVPNTLVERKATCTGDAAHNNAHQPPCPRQFTSRMEFSTGPSTGVAPIVPEGISLMGTRVADAGGNAELSARWKLSVDRSGPAISTAGSTLHEGGEPVTQDSYVVKVKATDGTRQTDATKRSGVVRLQIDTRQVKKAGVPAFVPPAGYTKRYDSADDGADPCTHVDASCEMAYDWTFRPADHDAGEHVVRITATDAAGNVSEKKFSVVVPPTVLAGASADFVGLENWWTYESVDTGADTQAHVNLANGNLVWHSLPVVNRGRGLSTVVNLTYNSLQRQPLPLIETPLEGLDPPSEVGSGFSLGISSLTRLNERLNVDLASRGRITLTDADGTRHHFTAEAGNEVFKAPPGVQLQLRRFSKPAPLAPAAFGYEELEDNNRAWAATRPDGVTYFFDRRGYQTSVEDRNGNRLTFAYAYRGLTQDACAQAATSGVFVLPEQGCIRKLQSVTDAGGRALQLKYQPLSLPAGAPGIPATCWNAAGNGENESCGSGRLKTIVDHLGRSTEFAYDGEYLAKVTQAAGTPAARSFDFGYETAAVPGTPLRGLTSITDPGRASGRTKTEIAYETARFADPGLIFNRRVDWIKDRAEEGTATRSRDFDYDTPSTGRTRVTDARSKATAYALDGRGRMTERVDARNAKTTLAWDDATTNDNNVSELREAAGSADEARTQMTYNANGLLLTSKDYPKGPADAARTTTLTYIDSGGRASLLSPRTTGSPAVSIDAGRGFVSDINTVEKPGGGTTDSNYSADGSSDAENEHRGNVTRQIDGEGNYVTLAYDAFGQITSEKDEIASNPTTKYRDYDANGLPRTVEDPKGGVWLYCYDAAGRMTRSTDPRGSGPVNGAPAPSCPTGQQRYSTELTYDSYDRLITQVVPKRSADGVWITRAYGYDANDNLVSSKDGTGAVQTRTYTAMDDVDRITSPATDHYGESGKAAEVTEHGYDAEENLTRVTSPRGATTPAAGDLESELRYDEVGNRVAAIRKGQGTEEPLGWGYAYDLRGNVVGVADPRHTKAAPGTPEVDVVSPQNRRFTYAFDRAGNRTQQVENPAQTGFALQTGYVYDDHDNLRTETDPRGKTKTYTYDRADRLTDETDPTGARTHYALRPNGQVDSETSPRGTATTVADDFTTTYTYNANNELLTRSVPKAEGQYGGLGGKVTYTRDAVGNPATITDARSGQPFTNTFLDSGELRSTGRPSWWIYDDGVVRERTPDEHLSDPAGRLPESEGHGDYGAVDPQKAPELLPRAGATGFQYDDELRLTVVTDSPDNPNSTGDDASRLTYDEVGRTTQVRQLIEAPTAASPAGRYMTEQYAYDRNGNPARVTDPRGNPTTNTYDGFDRLTRAEAPGNSNVTSEITDLAYDPNGNVVTRDTPRGSLAWDMTYDAADRMLSEENPANEATRFTYDATGNTRTKTTPRGNVWTYDYTDRDELAKVTAPDAGQTAGGRETTFGYDQNGNQTLEDRPGTSGGRILTRREFDGRDLPWTETVGAGAEARTTVTEYDANANLRREVNPPGVNSDKRPKQSWDGAKPTLNSTAADNATVYTYDADDVLRTIHLPFGDPDGTGGAPADNDRWRQDFTADARGRITSIDAPYRWDAGCDIENPANGQTPGQGCTSRTTYTYFDSGWVKTQSEPRRADPDSPTTTVDPSLEYGYDASGNQTAWKTKVGAPERRIVTRDYYADDTLKQRTAKETGTNPAPDRTFDYAYNANESLTRITDRRSGGDRITKLLRDDAERSTLVNESWKKGKDTAFAYDADGNATTRRTDGSVDDPAAGAEPNAATYKLGKTTSFAFDPLGRETRTSVCTTTPTPATCAAGSAQRTTTSTYYDGDGFLKTRTKPNGIIEDRSFDSVGQLTAMKRAKGTAVRKNQTYTYDPNGNRAKDERGTYQFNARSQQVKWNRDGTGGVVDYKLNGAGSVTSKTDGGQTVSYCFNADRITSAWTGSTCGAGTRAANYKYDPFGFSDLEKIELLNAGGAVAERTTYSYDAFGRMKTGDGPGTGASDTDNGSYVYDALDRRDTKTEAGETLDYSYVGLSESLSREDGLNGKSRNYDYDSSLNRLGQAAIPSTGGTPTYRSYGVDANGSVEELEDASGNVAADEHYLYDPYGKQENAESGLSAQAKGNPFRFQGFYYDGGISSYDMQARPYRPDIGRFLTQDRFEDATGDLALQSDPMTNDRYAFAGGNPVSNVEFDGHRPDFPSGESARRSARATAKVKRKNGFGTPSSDTTSAGAPSSAPAPAAKPGLCVRGVCPRRAKSDRPAKSLLDSLAGAITDAADSASAKFCLGGLAGNCHFTLKPEPITASGVAEQLATIPPPVRGARLLGKICESACPKLARAVSGLGASTGGSAVARRGTLRANLVRAHGSIEPGYEAHHMVAVKDPRAAGARKVLDRFNIDPNSAVNGVSLPGRGSGRVAGEAYHPSIHTDDYYEAVDDRLGSARTRREATRALGTIRRDIGAGEFP